MAILVFFLVFICFLPTTFFPLLYDDLGTIVFNSHVGTRSGVLQWILNNENYFQNSEEFSYRPVVTLTYCAERFFFGSSPHIYHVTNVLLHCLLSMAIVVLGVKLGLSMVQGGFAGLFFGLHPVTSEVVCLPSFREDILAALFIVLALFLIVILVRTGNIVMQCTCAIGSGCAALVAYMSKESAFV